MQENWCCVKDDDDDDNVMAELPFAENELHWIFISKRNIYIFYDFQHICIRLSVYLCSAVSYPTYAFLRPQPPCRSFSFFHYTVFSFPIPVLVEHILNGICMSLFVSVGSFMPLIWYIFIIISSVVSAAPAPTLGGFLFAFFPLRKWSLNPSALPLLLLHVGFLPLTFTIPFMATLCLSFLYGLKVEHSRFVSIS